MTHIIDIPVDRFSNFETVAKRLAKKAAKLGVTFSYEAMGTVVKEVTVDRDNRSKTFPVTYQRVSVEGEDSFKIGDWEVIARVDFLQGGSTIASFREDLAATFGDTDNHCDHCNYNRRRKTVVILENNEDGSQIQVGSTCLKDFTGHHSALALAEFYSSYRELLYTDYEDSLGMGSGAADFDVVRFLTMVDIIITEEGHYVSKASARRNGGQSTADISVEQYRSRPQDNINIPVRPKVTEALEWAASITDADNDYLHNISVIARSTYIGYKHVGYAASILPAYDRHVEDMKRKEAAMDAPESMWVGSIKERILTSVTLKDIKRFPDEWNGGTRYMYKMVDADGAVIVWWTSSEKLAELEDASFEVKATIKKHDEYNGVKQTVVSRVSVV